MNVFFVNGEIPSFSCGNIDLGLYNRRFTTGTIIKLYSYHLPEGSRSVISRDLNQSINEYLFQPALPVFTIETAERYPKDRNRQRELYGLKRRLEKEDSKYVDLFFSEDVHDYEIGHIKITCYVFKPRVDGRTAKETRETIQREFFKNNMSVLFSVNGQVHGHYTSEFITKSLKFQLLRDYLLVHVNCTDIHMEFRNELFMASRDRLKGGEESRKLRRKLVELLAKSRLKDIHKDRKSSITVENKDAEELVRNVMRNLPIRNELAELLSQTFKLNDPRGGQRSKKTRETQNNKLNNKPTFLPKRYPSFFKIDLETHDDKKIPMVQVPIGGERTIRFSTDVEDQYFDRIDEPGELRIGLLSLASNEADGGDVSGLPKNLDRILDVIKSSPSNGTIRVVVKPTEKIRVGDSIKLQASLSSPGEQFEQIFMVRISDPERKPKNPNKGKELDTQLGLPKLVRVYKDPNRDGITWDTLEKEGISMNHNVIVHPYAEGESLNTVYINMDSNTLLSYRSKLNKEETLIIAEKRYFSAVYFHTLFLYTITKNRKYGIVKQNANEKEDPIEVTEYISDLFNTFYAKFLLNFDTQELIDALET